MEKKINSLEDLKSIIDISKLIDNGAADAVDNISEDIVVGGDSTNTIVNRVFTYRFSQGDMEDIRRIYNKLKLGEINNGRIYNAINELRGAARDMRNNKTFPLEAILYGSKEINSLLCNNEALVDNLGDVIKEIYDTSECKYKKALQYIIANWKWTPQLNIAINACGKIKDDELLDLIYVNMTNDTKLEAFKAFINSGLQTSIPNIMKCIATVEEGDLLSNRICKHFNDYYLIKFGNEGITSAREYVMAPHFSRRAKKEINRILPVNNINKSHITLGDMINLAKIGDLENFVSFIKDERLKRNTYISLRWVPRDNDSNVKAESIVIKGLSNSKNKTNDIGEGLITLAMLGSNNVEKLVNEYLKKGTCIEYCYVALIIKGHTIYEEKLLDEIFENENISAYNALKQCKSKISNKFIQKLNEHLSGTNSLKLVKGLKVCVDFVNNDIFGVKNIILENLRIIIDKNSVYENAAVRVQFMKTIELIFDDKTKENLIPILFKVSENELSTINEKAKAKALLLSIGAEVPK